MGNLGSVYNAVQMVGGEARICGQPKELVGAERVILPGVGAFGDCMSSLRQLGFVEALNEFVRRGRPLLGVCLGMQAMARRGFEGGDYEGLGWFDAEVVRLQPSDATLRVPQIGWNEVQYRPGAALFRGLEPSPDFYFVHSYQVRCVEERDVLGTCDYGGAVTAAICRDNIVGSQFHPEKSQDHGLKFLENFLSWKP